MLRGPYRNWLLAFHVACVLTDLVIYPDLCHERLDRSMWAIAQTTIRNHSVDGGSAIQDDVSDCKYEISSACFALKPAPASAIQSVADVLL